jgi:hypothetical protein
MQPRPQSVFEPLVLRYNTWGGIQDPPELVPAMPVKHGVQGLRIPHTRNKDDISRSAQAGVRPIAGTFNTGAVRRIPVVPPETVVPLKEMPEQDKPKVRKDLSKTDLSDKYPGNKPQKPGIPGERPVQVRSVSPPAPDTAPGFPKEEIPAGKQQVPHSGDRGSLQEVPEPEVATTAHDLLQTTDAYPLVPVPVSLHELDNLPVEGISRKSSLRGRELPLQATGRELPQETVQQTRLPVPLTNRARTLLYQNPGYELSSVRVTIGRIEVRAVTPPPPVPQTINRPPVPRLSLQEYLKNRRNDIS